MKSLWSKFNQWYDKKSNQAPEPEEPESKKMPLIRLTFGAYRLFIDNTRAAFLVSSLYAVILTILFLSFGQGMMCAFTDNALSARCNYTILPYVISHLLATVIVAMFCLRYYQYAFCGEKFSWRWMFMPQKNDIRVILVLIGWILLNMLSMVSAYLLYTRVPNPDWRIEVLYFTVVSIGFLVPFLLMRFYSLFAFAFENKSFPPLKEVWQQTKENGLRLLFSFVLLFCVFVFSLNAVNGHFRLVAEANTFYIDIIAEYIFNLVALLNVVFFVNYCHLQKTFLYGEK